MVKIQLLIVALSAIFNISMMKAIAATTDSLVIKKSNSWTFKLYDPDMDEYSFELKSTNEYVVSDSALIAKVLDKVTHLQQKGNSLPSSVEGKIILFDSDSIQDCITLNNEELWHNGKTFKSGSSVTSLIDSICSLSTLIKTKQKNNRKQSLVPFRGGRKEFYTYLSNRLRNYGLEKEYAGTSFLLSVLLRIDKEGCAHHVYLRNYYNFKYKALLPEKLEVVLESVLLTTCWEKDESRRVSDLTEFPIRLNF